MQEDSIKCHHNDRAAQLSRKKNTMIRLVLITVSLYFLLGLSGQAELSGSHVEMRLNPKKPTVYITYQRMGPREPLFEGESKKGVWLRLHNNTRWKLVLRTGGVPNRSYGDAGLFYEIERTEGSGLTPIASQNHVASVIQLKPGGSLVFSLPLEHLGKGLAIHLRYNYEWELRRDGAFVRPGEPEHMVSFESSSLPD
jgi:hypothetical protein